MPGWTCRREATIFSPRIARRFKFRPRVDLLLSRSDDHHVVLELEVSRADPVANLVKFLIARRAGELSDRHAFVTMLSPAIKRGRRCIAAAFAGELRRDGITAFAVSLLPRVRPEVVAQLNEQDDERLAVANLPIQDEVTRLLAVLNPEVEGDHRIHFAGDVTEVVANVWRWNDDMRRPETARLWRTRDVQYFVFDPIAREFAPAKFCAYVPTARIGGIPAPETMTIEIYTKLPNGEASFDGNKAHTHLVQHLAFDLVPLKDGPVADLFAAWAKEHEGSIRPGKDVSILIPPAWFR